MARLNYGDYRKVGPGDRTIKNHQEMMVLEVGRVFTFRGRS